MDGADKTTVEKYGQKKMPEADGERGAEIIYLSVDKIYPNPLQPRKNFDENGLKELAESISLHGVIQPIVVAQNGSRYMIVAGERRFRASKLAGKTTVPAIVRQMSDRQISEIALIENLQREDLNPIEEAEAMKRIISKYGLTQDELADRLGKSRSAVANGLRLLNLNADVKNLVASGKLTAGHARAILSLPEEKQSAFARQAFLNGESVRSLEKRVKDYLDPPKKTDVKKPEISKELRDLVSRMQRTLKTKVTAVGNDDKGRIYVDYFTRDDLDRLSEIIDYIEETYDNV